MSAPVASPWAAPDSGNVYHIYTPPICPLEIIHLDDDIIAINKPAGLLSVPGRGPEKSDCAISRVEAIYPGALTVHRLDMSTSGLLLFARSKAAQRHVSRQFENGEIAKTYVADAWGTPSPADGHIDAPIIVDWPNKPRQKICPNTGKPSQTDYRTTGTHTHGARLHLTPKTGRTHQLRIHLASIGHEILGDEFYARQQAFDASPRLHLHASTLGFTHPTTGARVALVSDCPF